MYGVSELCRVMNVNRSGYYKWRSRQDKRNRYENDRILLTELLTEAHRKHRSYGYHRLATVVRNETGWLFSDNLAHKCCKYAGIKAMVRHYNYRHPLMGEEHNKYPFWLAPRIKNQRRNEDNKIFAFYIRHKMLKNQS